MDLSTYLLISIVYIPLNVFDLFIITRYMNTLYGLPRKGPYIKLLKIFIVLCASFLYAPYTALWGIAVLCIILLPFYNANKQKKFIFHITLVVLALTSLFTAFSLGESMALQDFYMGIFIIFLPHIIFFVICKLAGKVCAPTEVKLPYKMWLPLLAIPLISILGVAYISYLATHSSLSIEDTNMIQFPLLLMFLLVNIIVFYLYGKLSELVQKRVEGALFEQQLHLQEEHYQALINAHDQIRGVRHDMKNHLEAISILAGQHKDEEILRYLNDIVNQIELSDNTIFTGNSGIDAILNLKLSEAIRKGISISKSILVPHDLSIPFSDSVVILGNIFDNAIEACGRDHIKEPLICFKMQYIDSMLFIEIKNKTTSKNDPPNLLRSRKPDTAYHGLGLKNVRHIVERYNGTMNISIEDGFFTNKIILYGVQAKNDELPL